MSMTIKQRIAAALRSEPVDQIPFTIYPGMLPPGEDTDLLRSLGLGLSVRVAVAKHTTPHVKVDSTEFEDKGTRYIRTTIETPVGAAYATLRIGDAYQTRWYVDHYVKGPDDYRVMEYMIRDTHYEPDYDAYYRAVKKVGENGYVIGNFSYSPLMEMRVNLLGIERFSIDLYDRPDLFFSLYEVLRAKQREVYPILANSPADFVIYCGNCSPEILGHRFEEYVLPCYNDLGMQLHDKGKLLGCHLDANNKFWAASVATSALDVIEAFTPSPDTDLSVSDARRIWPDKVLWINFPSSLHLASAERIREATRGILAEAAPGKGFIIGITENIPEHAWRTSLRVIAEELIKKS